jgi:hypothetical protein
MENVADQTAVDWMSLDERFRRNDDEVEPNSEELADVASEMWGQIYQGLSALCA